MNEYLRSESTWQEYIICKIFKSARFRDQTLNIAIRGLIGKTETIKNTQINFGDYTRYLKREADRRIRINDESKKEFEESGRRTCSTLFFFWKELRVFLVASH